MTFKTKKAKSTNIPLLERGVQRVKCVSHHKYLGIVLDIELSDDKDVQRKLRYQKLLFPDFSSAVKNVLFRSFYT